MPDARGFDVVVVGSGSAGCVMAARLAGSGSRSVLLLEAGPDLRSEPPERMHDAWWAYREHGWGFESEPDLAGQTEPLYRGRIVGGTSWVTRFAMRGSPADFDLWAKLGNAGWSFEDVLPYFNRVETDLEYGDEPWHGNAGPLPVTRYPDIAPSEFEAAVAAGCAAIGFAAVDDHNRPGAVGAGRMPRNSRDRHRVTAADCYLPAAASCPNLTVRANAEVSSVLIEAGCAVGVRLVDGSVVRAGWVVLSAGVYGTPAILMRSGVGAAEHLRDVGVAVEVDLRGVGENLADHPGVDIDPGFRGEKGVAPRFFSLATLRTSQAGAAAAPDAALWTFDPWGGPDEPAGTAVAALLLTPSSRGRVRLRSAESGDPPRITLPGLREQSDIDRLVEAVSLMVDLVNRPELRRLCVDDPTPNVRTGDECRDWVLRTVSSYPHTVGTCAMGQSPDDGAVVDPSGHVYGVERLTIADASVFPTPPSGFPHLISIMMAERFAEQLSTTLA